MERCVLVVDDELVMGRMLVEGLGELGWPARTAAGPADALVRVERGDCSTVLSEVRLREGSGFEILRHVRGSTRSVPVILMTSLASEHVSRHACRAGAFAFLAKPFELAVLAALLHEAHGGAEPRLH